MNYIGSKRSLIPHIFKSVPEPETSRDVFCDAFAGTGVVSVEAKSRGFNVLANDWQLYSTTLVRAQLAFDSPPDFEGLNGENPIDFLNQLKGEAGLFSQAYGEFDSDRMYFSQSNARKIESCRDQIQNWWQQNAITEQERDWLIASLLEAADRVANTASIYGAYLKKIKKTAQQELHLRPVKPTSGNTRGHTVLNHNVLDLQWHEPIAVLYLDPPYNQRQYSANYHILETIARWDLHEFVPRGVTGLRKADELQSPFCSKKTAGTAMRSVLNSLPADTVIVSYNSDGIISLDELEDSIADQYKDVETSRIEYPRFRADTDSEKRTYKSGTLHEYILTGKKLR